jgi:hypothetical protein
LGETYGGPYNTLDTYAGTTSYNGGSSDCFVTAFTDGTRFPTYWGSSTDVDIAYDICTDYEENVYIAGKTNSLSFPTTTGASATFLSGTEDAFVTGFTGSGNLIFSTYYGGTGDDEAQSIDYVKEWGGQLVISGIKDSFTLPGTNINQPPWNMYQDGFVAMLANDGSSVSWSRHIWSSDDDGAYSAIVTDDDEIYVVGFSGDMGGGGYSGGVSDGFVIKLDLGGNRTWLKYLGTIGEDILKDVVYLDYLDQIAVVGHSDSDGYPLTVYADATYGGGWDGVFTILDPAPNPPTIQYSTYFGPDGSGNGASGNNYLEAIDYFPNSDWNDIVFVGWTDDDIVTYPPPPNFIDASYNGGTDGTMSRFTIYTGIWSKMWTSYCSPTISTTSPETVKLYDVKAIEGTGSRDYLIVAGGTNNDVFQTGGGKYGHVAGLDPVISKHYKAGSSRIWGTYYPSSSNAESYAVTLDWQDNPIITGYTEGSLPDIDRFAEDDTVPSSGSKAYICKFTDDASALLKEGALEEMLPEYMLHDFDEQPESLDIYPNPAVDYLNIKIAVGEEMESLITIADNLGRGISRHNVRLSSGSNNIKINVSQLPPGAYTISVNIGDTFRYGRFIRQ